MDRRLGAQALVLAHMVLRVQTAPLVGGFSKCSACNGRLHSGEWRDSPDEWARRPKGIASVGPAGEVGPQLT
ncbi:MAG: hypothetical protein ABIU54_02640 [Candidatus Eisenbacteria bacterium]